MIILYIYVLLLWCENGVFDLGKDKIVLTQGPLSRVWQSISAKDDSGVGMEQTLDMILNKQHKRTVPASKGKGVILIDRDRLWTHHDLIKFPYKLWNFVEKLQVGPELSLFCLQTDFSLRSAAVGCCTSVMKTICIHSHIMAVKRASFHVLQSL